MFRREKMISCSRWLIWVAVALLAACTPKQKIVDIPEAENLLFTPDGRLFVSGTGIFELVRQDGVLAATSLYDAPCGFAGIAQRDEWIYSVCTSGPVWATKGHLLAAKLTAHITPSFQVIAELDGVALPNGLAFDDRGLLYLADSNYFGAGKVIRLTLTEEAVPRVSRRETVLSAAQNVYHPNGVRIANDTLYLTDGGEVKTFSLAGDGTLSNPRVLYSGVTILDDLLPICGGAIVADYLGGKLFYVDRHGRKRYESKALSFPGASSVQIGQAPLFNPHQLVITEKGILLETGSRIGDALVTV